MYIKIYEECQGLKKELKGAFGWNLLCVYYQCVKKKEDMERQT
jgi:hypothetical protein